MDYTNILDKYLKIFPNEKVRQSKLKKYLSQFNSKEIIDWNNFEGHIVSSGFIYSKTDKKFLVLYHKDLNMFLYPGGHVDENDYSLLQTAKREIFEETGLKNLEILKISSDETIPFDIDTHKISYNTRLNLPEHYHFDFRYLFIVNQISKVMIDSKEHSAYKWIDLDELNDDKNFGKIISKLTKLISNI